MLSPIIEQALKPFMPPPAPTAETPYLKLALPPARPAHQGEADRICSELRRMVEDTCKLIQECATKAEPPVKFTRAVSLHHHKLVAFGRDLEERSAEYTAARGE